LTPRLAAYAFLMAAVSFVSLNAGAGSPVAAPVVTARRSSAGVDRAYGAEEATDAVQRNGSAGAFASGAVAVGVFAVIATGGAARRSRRLLRARLVARHDSGGSRVAVQEPMVVLDVPAPDDDHDLLDHSLIFDPGTGHFDIEDLYGIIGSHDDGFDPLRIHVPSTPSHSWVSEAELGLPSMLVKASVIDCGSGSTRAIFLKEELDRYGRSTTISRDKSKWRGEALAHALQDEVRAESLLKLLEEEIPDGIILMGATAGIRHALQSGHMCPKELEAFGARVQERLGQRAKFMVLSGEEEARAEWEATRYELELREGDIDPTPKDCAGMIAGGGMSCQLAIAGKYGAPDRFLSFFNGLLAPEGLVEKAENASLFAAELEDGLARHELAVRNILMEVPEKLKGTFSLIEWVGLYVGGEPTDRDLSMGLGYERMLTRGGVLAALDRHLAALQPASENEPVPRKAAVALVYGTVIKTLLLQAFDENAEFYCVSGVSWATGHYLLSKQVI